MEIVDGHVVRMDQPLAVELTSTIHVADGRVVDALTTTAQLRAWLAINEGRLDERRRLAVRELLPELRKLRDTLRRLFTAAVVVVEDSRPAVADIDALNELSGRAPDHLELRWTGPDEPHAEHVPCADPSETVLARLAADGIKVLTGTYGQLAACEGPSCVLFFVPTHPRQTWCSHGCGNRARVARHYRRSRSSP